MLSLSDVSAQILLGQTVHAVDMTGVLYVVDSGGKKRKYYDMYQVIIACKLRQPVISKIKKISTDV